MYAFIDFSGGGSLVPQTNGSHTPIIYFGQYMMVMNIFLEKHNHT